jgi:hypothetical protein
MAYLLAEIINEAEHFFYFSSIYDKKHQAKALGETSDNICPFSLTCLFFYIPFFTFSNSRVHVNLKASDTP